MAFSEKRHVIKAWLPVVLWMGVIFVASTDLGSATHTSQIIEPLVKWVKPDATPEQFELVHFIVRKTAHLTEYAILALLILRAVRLSMMPHLLKSAFRAAAITLLISASYAAMDEFHQSFVAGRTASPHDVLIDTMGACAGLTVAGLAGPTKRNKEKERIAQASPIAGE
jgi:VanZ family protein